MGEAKTGSLAAGWLRLREHGIEIRVRVVPRASREGIDGFFGDRLRVRLTAVPAAGEANDALLRLLARAARLAPSRGKIVAGPRDRSKTVFFECDEPREPAQTLRRAVAAAIDKLRPRI
jgi:uncharacterized protein YggU (UPF0235/DUF167 family)